MNPRRCGAGPGPPSLLAPDPIRACRRVEIPGLPAGARTGAAAIITRARTVPRPRGALTPGPLWAPVPVLLKFFSLTVKAEVGHDANMTMAEVLAISGSTLAGVKLPRP